MKFVVSRGCGGEFFVEKLVEKWKTLWLSFEGDLMDCPLFFGGVCEILQKLV